MLFIKKHWHLLYFSNFKGVLSTYKSLNHSFPSYDFLCKIFDEEHIKPKQFLNKFNSIYKNKYPGIDFSFYGVFGGLKLIRIENDDGEYLKYIELLKFIKYYKIFFCCNTKTYIIHDINNKKYYEYCNFNHCIDYVIKRLTTKINFIMKTLDRKNIRKSKYIYRILRRKYIKN